MTKRIEEISKIESEQLNADIFLTIEMLHAATSRFNMAEEEMVEECILEMKMLETRLNRFLKERREKYGDRI